MGGFLFLSKGEDTASKVYQNVSKLIHFDAVSTLFSSIFKIPKAHPLTNNWQFSFFPVKIASDAFNSLNLLQHLYLKKNLIMFINERHFKNLKNLIILDLSSNKIQNIHPSALNMLQKVSDLYLSQNSLNQIPENLFREMKSLKRLMLFSNDFKYLHAKSFIGLRLSIHQRWESFLKITLFRGV